MTLDEFIAALEAIRKAHGGNIYVVDDYNDTLSPPEFTDHELPGVVVVCTRA